MAAPSPELIAINPKCDCGLLRWPAVLKASVNRIWVAPFVPMNSDVPLPPPSPQLEKISRNPFFAV
ncbi:MAG: hypothetical protein CMO53_00580 [Verrucomicrobiales bacterium]|nr:hypothetical protein [Verrucomicrobiales bacterium]